MGNQLVVNPALQHASEVGPPEPVDWGVPAAGEPVDAVGIRAPKPPAHLSQEQRAEEFQAAAAGVARPEDSLGRAEGAPDRPEGSPEKMGSILVLPRAQASPEQIWFDSPELKPEAVQADAPEVDEPLRRPAVGALA